MKFFKLFLHLSLLFLGSNAHALTANNINIKNLKTEYTVTPLGIDVLKPRFSWQMEAKSAGAAQKAYQITVTDEAGNTAWNSGKITDDRSLNIRYQGRPLTARTRYNWTLKVWDLQNQMHTATSWFETGLMNSGVGAWNGARWIGGGDEDLVLYAQYLPVFKLNFTMQLDSITKSTRGGLLYGANDHRLIDPDKNYYRLKAVKNSSYIYAELNITAANNNGAAVLNVYRAGYKPGDKTNQPLKSFPVPTSIINCQNRYGKHTIYLSSVMGNADFWIDGEDTKNYIGHAGVNPIGQGGDFIAYPVLADVGFRVPQHQKALFSNLIIRNYRGPSNVLAALYTKPSSLTAVNQPAIVLTDPSRNATPMLRTTFNAVQGSKVSKARLYVTSRGIYDIYMNGKRITDDYFNPGLTQYNRTQLYQTFDVTGNVVAGKNAIGAMLGEGWWSGGSTYMGNYWNFFGDRQSLLAQLVITYQNGKEDTIVSSPEQWKFSTNGPVIYGSFFQGEVYDARKENLVQGWSLPGFDDSGWKNAAEVKLAGNINAEPYEKGSNVPSVSDFSNHQLIGQYGTSVKKVEELTARQVEEVRPGVFVYDMGQNMAGVPRIELSGAEPGSKIFLRFAEVKYPDLPEYKGNTGMIMLENIRAAMAQEIYTARGGHELIQPRFTYHGFRYIEVTGIKHALPLSAVHGVVLSSVHAFDSDYTSSDTLVNRLWKNITWSTLANFMSIPTDCPQRNERLGWSGDISVFSKTATYLATLPQFLRRHMLAMRDVQREDGRFPDVAPLGVGFGDILWGSAGITVAWESYQQYADLDMLAEHYDAMQKYIKFVGLQIDTQTNVLDEKNRTRWASLGDWLSPEYDKTEKTLLWEAYYIYDLRRMSRIARLLGKAVDASAYEKLANARTAFFNKTYIDPATGKTIFRDKTVDTQTSYAVPLAFDIISKSLKAKATAHLVNAVSRVNTGDKGQSYPPYSLMTGFIGTSWISTALSETDNASTAYRQLMQTTYPSWLYPVTQGATTIWERLNSYTHTDGFGGNNNMNSFNHYSFGAVGGWLVEHSLGIRRDESSPGFKHFILAPEPDLTRKMTSASGYYESMYGRIECSWVIQKDKVVYNFHVPANTKATLLLKVRNLQMIRQILPVASMRRSNLAKLVDGQYIAELLPGDYRFEETLK